MWVKLDDGFAEHPKIARVGAVGAWLQVQALCYANRNLTDGFIPHDVAQTFAVRGSAFVDDERRHWTLAQTSGSCGRDVTEVDWPTIMVRARLWEVVPGGYVIHDYPDYQPTRAQVLAERERAATSMRQLRKRRGNATTAAGENGYAEVSRNKRYAEVSRNKRYGNVSRNDPQPRATTGESGVLAVSYGTPVPVKKEDPDARARALQVAGRARARPDPVPDPDATRRRLADCDATPPYDGPVRLVDLLAAARAALELERERSA